MEKIGDKTNIEGLLKLDERRRELLVEVEQLKSKQNTDSMLVPQLKKEGKDVSSLMEDMKQLSDNKKDLDVQVREIDEEIDSILLTIPNIQNETVPPEILMKIMLK